MKLSYNWLQQYIDLSGKTPEEVGEKLTLHTCELEEVVHKADSFKGIIVAELTEIKDHPEADTLGVAAFDLGTETVSIVFAKKHDMKVGKAYPVAKIGAQIGDITIVERKVRGITSQGMICDNVDLGMKNEDLLSFNVSEKGKALVEVLPECGDQLLDIDNKSLTHRPDLMGHRGFVRELGVIFDKTVEVTNKPLTVDMNQAVKVSVDTDNCKRFIGVRVEGVDVKASSLETQIRLENVEVRSISNLVDITNWILLEYGQPMHVFDADKIQGDIVVRQAKDGEQLEALDGETYELNTSDMVIADSEKVLSIAGIMGGLESGVTESTTNVIFECASFDPVCIRKTSSRLGLRSESSMRFEKTLDPEACEGAMQAALDLLESGKILGGMDVYTQKPEPITITCTTETIRSRAGIKITDEAIIKILTGLGFVVSNNDGLLSVMVPSWRATKDVSIAEDLIEEVVRMYGFDNIPSLLPTVAIKAPKENLLRSFEWSLRDFWSQAGYFETKHYSFVPASDPFLDHTKAVSIANPLSEQTAVMRQTLLSRMMMDIETEVRTHQTLSVFEVGKTYIQQNDVLPVQSTFLGCLKSGINVDESTLFYQLKSDIEVFAKQSQLSLVWKPLSEQTLYSHPGKSAEIQTTDGIVLGLVTAVHPTYKPLKKAPVVFAEINVEAWLEATKKNNWQYKAPSPYPATHRDISFIVDKKVLVGDIEQALEILDENIVEVALFDSFESDEKIGVGKKNLAFHVGMQSQKKTLEEEDVNTIWDLVTSALEKTFAATIRDV